MEPRQKIGIGIAIGLIFGIWLTLREAPVSVARLMVEPVHSLLGSPQQLQTGVLEVSENVNSVQEATRRLFKPLGAVRLIRRYPSTPPSTTTTTTDTSSPR